jgi:hypothetical protein
VASVLPPKTPASSKIVDNEIPFISH